MNVEKYCKDLDTKYLDKLTNIERHILIYYSFICITKDIGNIKISKKNIESFY